MFKYYFLVSLIFVTTTTLRLFTNTIDTFFEQNNVSEMGVILHSAIVIPDNYITLGRMFLSHEPAMTEVITSSCKYWYHEAFPHLSQFLLQHAQLFRYITAASCAASAGDQTSFLGQIYSNQRDYHQILDFLDFIDINDSSHTLRLEWQQYVPMSILNDLLDNHWERLLNNRHLHTIITGRVAATSLKAPIIGSKLLTEYATLRSSDEEVVITCIHSLLYLHFVSFHPWRRNQLLPAEDVNGYLTFEPLKMLYSLKCHLFEYSLPALIIEILRIKDGGIIEELPKQLMWNAKRSAFIYLRLLILLDLHVTLSVDISRSIKRIARKRAQSLTDAEFSYLFYDINTKLPPVNRINNLQEIPQESLIKEYCEAYYGSTGDILERLIRMNKKDLSLPAYACLSQDQLISIRNRQLMHFSNFPLLPEYNLPDYLTSINAVIPQYCDPELLEGFFKMKIERYLQESRVFYSNNGIIAFWHNAADNDFDELIDSRLIEVLLFCQIHYPSFPYKLDMKTAISIVSGISNGNRIALKFRAHDINVATQYGLLFGIIDSLGS